MNSSPIAIRRDTAIDARVNSYDLIAGIYDRLAAVYSFGQINAAKADQQRFLRAEDRVLFIGCGCGREVVKAAASGCRVSAVDASPKMIHKLQRRAKRSNVSIELICRKFQDIPWTRSFDVVASNFFFNCFPFGVTRQLMLEAALLIEPGGLMLIADVAPPQGNVLARVTNQAYLHAAMLPFWLCGLVHWHKNHDYRDPLEQAGFQVQNVTEFRLARVGPVVFRNIIARKLPT